MSDLPPIRVRAVREGARLPLRATPWSAGADLHAIDGVRLAPGERRLVPTGISVEIPSGYYGRIAPRSGLAVRHGIDTLAGVVDSDYRGEINVLLVNLGDAPVELSGGERIAQLIVEQAAPSEFMWAETLADSVRGDGGFGSTGS
ncbi:MAG: dUTP diphosphatase [Acidobacteria bacterium]|nr:dUTP diphosphatase [Acidobacteriota bacterium]